MILIFVVELDVEVEYDFTSDLDSTETLGVADGRADGAVVFAGDALGEAVGVGFGVVVGAGIVVAVGLGDAF